MLEKSSKIIWSCSEKGALPNAARSTPTEFMITRSLQPLCTRALVRWKSRGRLSRGMPVSVAMASSSTASVPLCVHAPTAAELGTARELLQQADAHLVAKPGEPPTLCSLDYHTHGAEWQAHCGAFDAANYFSMLQTRTLGRVLFTAAALPSTQTVVQDNVAVLPDGVLVVADAQLGGKGRGGNTWASPGGCLMFSACAHLEVAGQRLPFVQYLVSLAVVQAVQAAAAAALGGGTTETTPLDVRIKWPNDVYAGGLKLGGILCHSSYRGQRFRIIMGVGLNVANRQPTTCVDALIEAEAARRGLPLPPPLCREALLADILSRLEPMLSLLSAQGFEPFESDYYSAWLHSGQPVEVEEEVEGGGKRRVGVTIRGLSAHGYLRAEEAGGGQAYELHPDGNSLDFFKGLVRKKLPAA